MEVFFRALWPPIVLRPWFLWLAGCLSLAAGLFLLLRPEAFVRLSMLSDPRVKRPSTHLIRWILTPALFVAGVVTLWYASVLQTATR
ncbi:MAG: hypothetical protein HYT87_19460 [Nitrospirae bacterium]|nr:hypothetical protein [Nitrospirota bacterium]